jgi:shikimate dehydrogenase
MPHKAVVVEWLDEVSAAVRAAGACNALRRSGDGKLIGAMFATIVVGALGAGLLAFAYLHAISTETCRSLSSCRS